MPSLTQNRGLVTLQNELARPEGALVKADNVVIDADNIVEPRRGFSEYGDVIPGSLTAKQVMQYKGRIFRHYSNILQYDNGSGTFTSFSGNYSELVDKLRIKYQEANSNLYFTTSSGIKKISAKSASEFSSSADYIRNAGGIKAIDLSTSLISDSSGFLPANSKVSYRLVWGNKDKNNNLILGAPSARSIVTNTSTSVNIGEQSLITVLSYSGINASEYIILNTPTISYFVWFDTTGSSTQPADSNTVGKLAIKVNIHSATSNAEVANRIGNAISTQAATIFSVIISGTQVEINNIEPGNSDDPSNGTVGITHLTVAKVFDGQISEGMAANVNLNFTIPQDILSLNSSVALEYFYQVYRTAYVTDTENVGLENLDPGDEHQLVYEQGLVASDLTAGEVTFTDITPDTFRAGGLPLYTNPVSGGGILSANNPPPIAQDITLFRQSLFFSNTKTYHREQFNLLAVDDFISGVTKFFVGNEDKVSEYTFVGAKEITTLDVLPKSQSVGNSYITLNSASNQRKYYLWLDKGTINLTFNSTSNVNVGTDTITITNHGLATNDLVTIGGTLPAGLSAGNYYVIRVDANNIQLSLTVSGSAENITATAVGTGTILHSPSDPLVSERIGIRIPLQTYDDTLQGSKDALLDSLFDFTDFSATDTDANTVTIECTNNGDVDAPTYSTVAPGWTFMVTQEGDGEDVAAKEVLLSGFDSAALSVDETARSLVKVINRDPDSPVNATYLSGPDDLPGIILFESRQLDDIPFYIGVSPTAASTEFNPQMPLRLNLQSISALGLFTTTAAHGLSAGDQIYIHDNPGSAPTEFGGVYTIATTPAATTFTLVGVSSALAQPGPLSGVVFLSTVESDNEKKPNRLYYSKVGQPDAVPALNYIDIGAQDKEISRIIALRDNLFILKEDGVFLLSGFSAPNWSVRPVDMSVSIIAPDTAVGLANQIYCLTTQGVVSITESGLSVISRNIENLIQRATLNTVDYKLNSFGLAYESDRSYLLWMPEKSSDTTATQCFRYNTFTRTWTRWTKGAKCGLILTSNDKMYIGDNTRSYINQERKDKERQDYSDRDFSLTLGDDAINDTSLTLSSVVDLMVGDVLVQTQYVSITKFNNLLKKLDADPAPTDSNYFVTLQASAGNDMALKLIALKNKLQSDVNLGSFTFSTPTGINTLSALQTDYNNLIDDLNDPTCPTGLKDYKQVIDLISHEVVIQSVNLNTNTVIVNTPPLFIEGEVRAYKAIRSEIQWAPQHFGQPEMLKQVREGTFMFDQNNFYGGTVGYASDRSADFSEVAFTNKGPGFWGGFNWGDAVWGGDGNEVGVRTLIPQNKQRCRFINIKFNHNNARELYRITGVSLEPRVLSPRGYR